MRWGWITIGPIGVTRMVCPSALAAATSAAPMVPAAPTTFLTMVVPPSALAKVSCNARTARSVAPPAGQATTRVTGFSG